MDLLDSPASLWDVGLMMVVFGSAVFRSGPSDRGYPSCSIGRNRWEKDKQLLWKEAEDQKDSLWYFSLTAP